MTSIRNFQDKNKREYSTITSANCRYSHDHCCWTVDIYAESKGGGQGCTVVFDSQEEALDYAFDVAQIFNCKHIDQIVGRQCWVLRPFGYHSDQIEGFEVDDRRFTRTGWQRKNNPNAPSRLDRERKSLLSTMEWVQRRVAEAIRDLKSLEENYTEWTE